MGCREYYVIWEASLLLSCSIPLAVLLSKSTTVFLRDSFWYQRWNCGVLKVFLCTPNILCSSYESWIWTLAELIAPVSFDLGTKSLRRKWSRHYNGYRPLELRHTNQKSERVGKTTSLGQGYVVDGFVWDFWAGMCMCGLWGFWGMFYFCFSFQQAEVWTFRRLVCTKKIFRT